MIKVYDEVLGREERIHEHVPEETEREIILNDPDDFEKIFETEVDDD